MSEFSGLYASLPCLNRRAPQFQIQEQINAQSNRFSISKILARWSPNSTISARPSNIWRGWRRHWTRYFPKQDSKQLPKKYISGRRLLLTTRSRRSQVFRACQTKNLIFFYFGRVIYTMTHINVNILTLFLNQRCSSYSLHDDNCTTSSKSMRWGKPCFFLQGFAFQWKNSINYVTDAPGTTSRPILFSRKITLVDLAETQTVFSSFFLVSKYKNCKFSWVPSAVLVFSLQNVLTL